MCVSRQPSPLHPPKASQPPHSSRSIAQRPTPSAHRPRHPSSVISIIRLHLVPAFDLINRPVFFFCPLLEVAATMGRTLPWKPGGHPSTTKPPTSLHPTRTASPPQGTSLSRSKPAAPSARPTLVSGPVPPRSPAPSPAHSRTDGSASPPSSPPLPSEGPIPERSVSVTVTC